MKSLFDIKKEFLSHFGYLPNTPHEINFDEKGYGEILQKCVKDNFDYTIELYGTDPKYGAKKHSGVFID